jgi:SAM-dependent methyltransferase
MPLASRARPLDALTSATLKHVRDEWWDDAFTAFLVERLRPRAGNRILDVGCGTGVAELRLSRLRLSQVTLVGVDLFAERTAVAERAADGHNMRASFAAADACHLPFPDGSFDSTFCVAVLQHVGDPSAALREFARATRDGGRIVAVEPDNAARYWYSSLPEGMAAFAASQHYFEALAAARREPWEPRVGPRLPALFIDVGVEPLEVQLFPVSVSRLGPPDPSLWTMRFDALQASAAASHDAAVRDAADDFRRALTAYREAAAAAGSRFVEIHSTLLFGVVGQRVE